jgi:hypothetical protein
MPAGRAEAHWRRSDHAPSAGANFYGAPALIGEVKINVSGMLGDADMDRPLRGVKLCPGLEQIERRPDRFGAQGLTGLLVIATSQPGPKAFAANRPGLPLTVDQEIGKCGVRGGVKQLAAHWRVDEHVGRRYADAVLSTSDVFKAGSESVPCAIRSGRIRPSLTRVCFQSLRATLSGSIRAACHHARSSPAR